MRKIFFLTVFLILCIVSCANADYVTEYVKIVFDGFEDSGSNGDWTKITTNPDYSWDIVEGAMEYSFSPFSPYEGRKFAFLQSDADAFSDIDLVSPPIDCSQCDYEVTTTLGIDFAFELTGWLEDENSDFALFISQDFDSENPTWIQPSQSINFEQDDTKWKSQFMRVKADDFPSGFWTSFWFAFRYQGHDDSRIGLDNIGVWCYVHVTDDDYDDDLVDDAQDDVVDDSVDDDADDGNDNTADDEFDFPASEEGDDDDDGGCCGT